jgi:cytidine deaminase
MGEYISKVWVPSEQEIAQERAWILAQLAELGEPVEDLGMDKLSILCETARDARENAYVPYSHYHVGAAILTKTPPEGWKIFPGLNNENVNYSNTGHAESNAVRLAIIDGCAKETREFIRALAVCHAGDSGPCGACLQDLEEHAVDGNALIIIINPDGEPIEVTSLKTLLPKAFNPRHLGIT